MNRIVEYFMVIIIAVLASAITSYEVASNLQVGTQNQLLPQTSNDLPQTRVNLTIHRVYIANPNSDSSVEVAFSAAVHNLTIVYRYTALNATTFTKSVDYGNYVPTWNTADVISPGVIPSLRFRIPDDIILVSSSTKTYYAGEGGGLAWDIYPQVEAIEAYGYA